MGDDTKTWELIHSERSSVADTLEGLAPEQWSAPSLCGGWSVQLLAAHIVNGAEQTTGQFFAAMAANSFRFNRMMDREARALQGLAPEDLVTRLRARTTTTNRAPAPVVTMLGEIVIHGEDLRQPLGIPSEVAPEATVACLEMYKKSSFPTGTKKRIAGLTLTATDVGWSLGNGPEVSGPGMSLLLAMTGRPAGLEGLGGEGLDTMRSRTPA